MSRLYRGLASPAEVEASLTVNGALAAIDAYADFYQRQSHWAHVENRGMFRAAVMAHAVQWAQDRPILLVGPRDN